MEHYRETKDTREAADASGSGLRVETLRCGWWTPLINFHGTLYFDNGENFVPTTIDRVYRIEVKPEAPKLFTGPTCEMTPELLDRMREHCEKQCEQDGACIGLTCLNCPGSKDRNKRVHCDSNGWSGSKRVSVKDPIAKANCEKFLAEHPAQPKKRLERVEFFRDTSGTLKYAWHGFLCPHTRAISEKGFWRYVMANGDTTLQPVQYGEDGNEFPVAFERWVEEGE